MFVTRRVYDALESRYNALETRYEALLEKYHALRVAGATVRPSVETAAVIEPPATEYDRMISAHKEQAIRAAALEFQRSGISAEQALSEAERLITATYAPVIGEMQ